jgi:tRNA(His) 5'-end guanylyltransferase
MDLGDRMKQYEAVSQGYLTRRMPVIIRIDGKAFHTFTRGLRKPFDDVLMGSMIQTAAKLCGNISGSLLAYTQSDEISILLQDWKNIDTQPWFDNKVQKMCSVAASMATLHFNNAFADYVNGMASCMVDGLLNYDEKELMTYVGKCYSALFDARVFTLPKEEVANYFIWRQQDATRNAIQMVGHANFSDKEMFGKNMDEVQEMLFSQKQINFNDFPTQNKRGTCVIQKPQEVEPGVIRNVWVEDKEIPVFTADREYIEHLLELDKE